MAENQTNFSIDLSLLSDKQKKAAIVGFFMSMCNMNSLKFDQTLDWSTSNMQIHVNSNLVLVFLSRLDFDRTCQNDSLEKCQYLKSLQLFSIFSRKLKKMAGELSCFEKMGKKRICR